MKAKTKIGMSMKVKKKVDKKKKQIFPTAKRDGALSILPILSTLGSLISEATSVVKAVNDRKAARRQPEELQHHNRAMKTRGRVCISLRTKTGGDYISFRTNADEV
ncbi:hypothetical protein P5V15_009280 [Pogonomyrmex californicus]